MMQQDHIYDVVVVGGGLVGSSCAVALAQQGFKVGLLDKRALQPAENASDSALDSRVYTITPGNADWLSALDVWSRLDAERVAVVDEMHVWGDHDTEAGVNPSLKFNAYASHLSQLAFVVEEKVLQTALWKSLLESSVEVINGSIVDLDIGLKAALLSLEDGMKVHSRLIVAADGGNSLVRSLAGIATRSHAYGQEGVVANFETELPHQNIARQWFMREGVMAWLPLPGNRISLVWSTADSAGLMKKDGHVLAETVAEAGGKVLGAMTSLTPAQSFPLALRIADSMAKPRLVMMGDAAHQIHPLAGQGVNLGFRDVRTLAETLVNRKRHEDIGSYMVLRRFERARKVDLLEMQLVTHGLNWLFESNQPASKALRNWGLRTLDKQSFLKRQLVRQAV